MGTALRSRRGSVCFFTVAILAAVALPAAASGASVATPPSAAHPTVTLAAGIPKVPFGDAIQTTVFGLSAVGYQQAEFFVAGDAVSFHNNDAGDLSGDGTWSVSSDDNPTAYKTRAQVYRPKNAADFNGTVYIEWLNVTNGSDTAPDWLAAHNEIIREGAAYVGLTTQAIGVNAAVSTDPARYGAAGGNLQHPGDSFSYDIFSQGAQAVRDNQAMMLSGFAPLSRVIALGESQSASRMVTYINAIQPLHHEYDGFLVHSRGAGASALRQSPLDPQGAVTRVLIRTDVGVPVFVFQTETDTTTTRQPDSSTFRQWEVAGSAHLDLYSLGSAQFDNGHSQQAASNLFTGMLHPVPEPIPGVVARCTLGVNAGPGHWTLQAAFSHLNRWVTDGTLPPSGGPGLTTTNPDGTGALVLDAHGNATGGIRSPHVDVPVATLRGTGNSTAAPGPINFCFLFGTTTAFDQDTLNALYPTHAGFVAAWNASVDSEVAVGFILAADAPFLKQSAADSLVGGAGTITDVGPLHAWLGLRGARDATATFDVRAELLVDGAVVASGTTRCMGGFAFDPAAATETTVPFGPVNKFVAYNSVLTMRISARLGTNADDTACDAKATARGLRLFYDGATRASRFDDTVSPGPDIQQYLHSDGKVTAKPCRGTTRKVTAKTTNAIAPVAVLPKCRDTASMTRKRGNAWQVFGEWTLPSREP